MAKKRTIISGGRRSGKTFALTLEKQKLFFACNKQKWGDCECVDKCRRGYKQIN